MVLVGLEVCSLTFEDGGLVAGDSLVLVDLRCDSVVVDDSLVLVEYDGLVVIEDDRLIRW